MPAQDELIAAIDLGVEARRVLDGKLFQDLLEGPLQATKDTITALQPHETGRFHALAIRRETLAEVVTALRSLVEQGEDAGRALAGEATGTTSRIC